MRKYKTWLCVLFGTLCAVSLCFGAAACGEAAEHEHTFEWVTRSPATCTQGGTEVRRCTVCGKTEETRDTAPLEHRYEWKTFGEPSCAVNGVEKEVCTVCGDVRDTRESDPLPHTPGQFVQGEEYHYRLCTVCGQKLDAEAHRPGMEYTAEGTSHYTSCTVCGARMTGSHVPSEGAEITAEGHDFDCALCGAHAEGAHDLETAGEWLEGDGICKTCGFETYTVSDGILISYRGSAKKVRVPAEYLGKPVTGIGAQAFSGNTALTEIVLPDTVRTVGDSAFRDCSALTRIEAGGTEEIGKFAFANCVRLSSADLGGALERIGDAAFTGCVSLSSLTLPASLTVIGGEAFSGAGTRIVWAEHPLIKEIGYSAFKGWLGTTFTFPAGLMKIGDNAFENCVNMAVVNVPDGVCRVGAAAFKGCTQLQAAVLGEGLQGPMANTFENCTSLNSVTIRGNILTLQDTFKGCSHLQTVTLLSTTLECLFPGTFSGCTSLTAVYVNFDYQYQRSVLRAYPFDTEVMNHLYLHYDADPFDSGLFDNTMFLAWHYDDGGNIVHWRKHGKEWIYTELSDGTYGVTYKGKNNADVVVPDSHDGIPVTKIIRISQGYKDTSDHNAELRRLDGLITSIDIPSSVTSFGEGAFAYTGITGVDLTHVTEIPRDLFYHCDALEEIVIPDNVVKLNENSFANLQNLRRVVIGAGITEIPYDSFYWLPSLEGIVIPNTVKRVDRTFEICPSLKWAVFDWTGDTVDNVADNRRINTRVFIGLANATGQIETLYIRGEQAVWEKLCAAMVEEQGGQYYPFCKAKVCYYSEENTGEGWHWNDDGTEPVLWGKSVSSALPALPADGKKNK